MVNNTPNILTTKTNNTCSPYNKSKTLYSRSLTKNANTGDEKEMNDFLLDCVNEAKKLIEKQ
jgi:hypothetical protein